MERQFGEDVDGIAFAVLDEREIRASAGFMFLLGLFASINAFVLKKYFVVPYIAGFLVFNFAVGILFNPRYAPTMLLGRSVVKGQTPLYIGAIQKKFAFGLGLGLSSTIFVLSLFLIHDVSYFNSVCMLCLICLFLLFSEMAFGICMGCQLYFFFIRMGWLKAPAIRPNCMGDACPVD